MKKLFIKAVMTVEESDKYAGKLLKAEDCKKVFSEDVDLYDKDTKQLLAKFRTKVIPGNIQKAGYENLLEAATVTDNRRTAGAGKPVTSGVAGYFDPAGGRFPICRLTAFNQHSMPKFKAAYPIFKFVDNAYAELVPDKYKAQKAIADKTSQDFVIPGTSFTTITINKNYETAVHKDSGDFKDGFGNLVALRKGKYTGCYFTLVRWGVGFDMQNGDLLMVDVHQWHGNTPMIKHEDNATRLSLVMYYREKMYKCGSMAQELKKAKERKINYAD
jgi:hypothetical protein